MNWLWQYHLRRRVWKAWRHLFWHWLSVKFFIINIRQNLRYFYREFRQRNYPLPDWKDEEPLEVDAAFIQFWVEHVRFPGIPIDFSQSVDFEGFSFHGDWNEWVAGCYQTTPDRGAGGMAIPVRFLRRWDASQPHEDHEFQIWKLDFRD